MNVTVQANRWKLGWELILDDENATQVRVLSQAADQVRDYLDTVDPAVDHSDWSVTVVPNLGSLISEVREAQEATKAAAEAQVMAGEKLRSVVARMRKEGLSVTDTAAILGVSRGRVSQLAS
jgi:DNA-directed RNA polymerase specialized sigma subunit